MRFGLRRVLPPVIGSVLLAACSGDHNLLNPKGPEAGRVSALGWGMIITATIVTVFVFGLLVAALLPGDRRGLRRITDRTYLVGGGIALPLIVVLTLSGLTITTLDVTARRGDVQIDLTGHQFWWEVRYPGTEAVTANEIHIPAGERVRFTLRSADVIHSVWVPALAGKIDMVPGHTNHLVVKADKPGTYRGQCAEFCGLQHARMAFVVIAQTRHDYERWLKAEATPASVPAGQVEGQGSFNAQPCSGCHTIRGTQANGKVGPDLTHVASRRTLGALTIPNDREHLSRWIVNAQQYKKGALMPPIQLPPTEQASIVSYLESLR